MTRKKHTTGSRLLPFLLAFAATPLQAEEMIYPATRATDVADEQFGEKIADPYRWLENDVRSNADVQAWVMAQNGATNTYLATLPGRDVLAGRMRKLLDFERIGTPRKAGTRYFYTRNAGLQNQSVLMVRDGTDATPRVLIDPNQWAKDGATALAEWLPSPDGKLLAYAVQDGGTDWRIVRFLDVETGQPLTDEIRWVKFSELSWLKDGSGLFYSRFPAPKAKAAFQSTNYNQSVYLHRIGTVQKEDKRIYATPDRPILGHSAEVTDDGQYLLITSSAGTDERYELHVAKLGGKHIRPKTLVRGLEHEWALAGSIGSTFWLRTNLGAPRGRIVAVDVEQKEPSAREILRQSEDTIVGANIVGSRLIVAYLGDAKSVAELRTLDGKLLGPIALPGIGTAAGFGGKAGDAETFYTFSSFAVAPTVYRFDTDTGKATIWSQPKTAFDPDHYVTEQVFYPSKDGTKIPMFLVRKKGLAKPGPTLLYGYGGFNIAQTPSFSATRLAWLEQGGTLAIANLRGGGEYGAEWHDAGRLSRKQNVFDDFIAAGEWLIAQGITTKEALSIEGRSNGGLLVGAVVNQRPDLFAAAIPSVGVMDMLRFNRFTAGRYWVDDYGDPAKEADFRNLRAYSPYHNVKAGTAYPAILVTTADTDDRVVPGHSFKYVAALQAAKLGSKPQLIRIETRAGHGTGKPTDKVIAEESDKFAFLAKWTGLEIKGE